MKKQLSKKFIWIIGIALIIAGIILIVVLNGVKTRKEAATSIQTMSLEKGDLTAIIGATGSVRANQSTTLAWQTGGRVEKIRVQVGDTVQSDEVLASLLESSLPQSVILAKADLVTAQRELDDLLTSNVATAQAQLNLANAKDNYDREIWSSLPGTAPRTTNQDKIDAAQATVWLAEEEVDNALEFYDRFATRDDDDPIKATALSSLANARQNLTTARKNLTFLTQIPNAQEVAISDGEVAVALAEYDDALREWERVKDGPAPEDISAAQARITAIEATIKMAEITSPFDGTVTEVLPMVGDQVNSGTEAFRVDDLSRLLVDVQVPEVDINRVQVGQTVDLTFDAINARQYQGHVIEVGRVGLVSEGIVNFAVTIEILNPDENVLPGMTAAVNVIVSQLTDVLTVPNRAVRVVDNKRVIYVLKNGISTAVEIEIGASSDTLSEVISGDIKEGDVIILNPAVALMDLSSAGGPPF